MTQPSTIGLILEGTYPYVKGGVSSWVYQLIQHYSDLEFSIIHLSAEDCTEEDVRYDIPDNVTSLKTVNIFSPIKVRNHTLNSEERSFLFEKIKPLHAQFRRSEDGKVNDQISSCLHHLFDSDTTHLKTLINDIFNSEQGWNFIQDTYKDQCPADSFRHYYWTLVSMHTPLIHLFDLIETLPKHHIYHSISTGYAGFLASLLSHRDHASLILSEHGIYTKERKIDLSKVSPNSQSSSHFYGSNNSLHFDPLNTELDYTQQLWIRYFQILGQITYQQADPIISLYKGNQQRQWNDGASKEKTRIIPNGINVESFSKLREKRCPQPPKIVGLIGRVVPIKDIKTFIKGMKELHDKLPEVEGWIIGPTEEDEAYAKECHILCEALELSDVVKFLGFQRLHDILPQLGLTALTSISEAQPLVLLESFAAGVPGIATDVGACRELIKGLTPEDQTLGSAGAIIPIANPSAFSEACYQLLSDEDRWKYAQEAAIKRVETYYTESLMFQRYRAIYQEASATSSKK